MIHLIKLAEVGSLVRSVVLVLAVLGSLAGSAAGQPVEETLREEGIGGGIVALVGVPDPPVAGELVEGGRYLVHVLLVDAQGVERVREAGAGAGLSGLVSAMRWREPGKLPYASGLVNLLVVDLEALNKSPFVPTPEELRRVVVPGGVMLLKESGVWSKTLVPRPEGMDSWGHFDHGADGNPLSSDTLVEPVEMQQWITGVQPSPSEGNPAGYDPGGGIRVWDRYAVLDVNRRTQDAKGKEQDDWVLQGRDAFNGTPLWTLPRDKKVAGNRLSLVAAEGEVYCWLDSQKELVALSLRDGGVLRAYGGTAAAGGVREEVQVVRVAGDALLVGTGEAIMLFDRGSGELRWRYARDEGGVLLGPVMDPERGRVYAIVRGVIAEGERRVYGGRWPVSQATRAVVALDLADGGVVWENTDVASREVAGEEGKVKMRGVGQLVAGPEHLIVFGSAAISGGSSPFIASLDLRDGELVHATDEPFKRSYNVSSYNVLIRDGWAYFAGAFTNVWRYNPTTGEVQRVLTDSWNQRCTRFTATPNYFLFGQSAFYTPDFDGTQVAVARSGCAMGNVPANGMTYFTPNACGCITQVRGFQAMTGDAAPSPTPDDRRRVTDLGMPVAWTADASVLPAGPVAEDWRRQWRAGQLETEPLMAGDVELVAVVQQHRLEARRDGKVIWSVTADGRISAPPVVVGDVVAFGSHDGCVYGVSLADGRPLWRYQVAPAIRLIGVNGQLENAWPVYGVAVQQGHFIASAGTHAELAGGVTVVALDPATGTPQWVRHLVKQSATIPVGGKGAQIVSHSFVNSTPRIDGDTIALGDGGRRGGNFSFTIDEDENAINTRLNTPQKKKK